MLRSAAPLKLSGAPLPKILKAGAQAGAPLMKNLRSASRSAAPNFDENRGRSARSEILTKFNSLIILYLELLLKNEVIYNHVPRKTISLILGL